MTEAEIESCCQEILSVGFCIIRKLLPVGVIDECARAFEPILDAHMDEIREKPNRGPNRHFIKLPFEPPFANPVLYENETILSIVEALLGADAAIGSYASDTPLQGSVHQDFHGDVAALFPDTELLTPPYILAVNFPFVDVTAENGPFEVARGSQHFTRDEGLRKVEGGEMALEPLFLNRGDVLVRDPRTIHRGTPNGSTTPRPVAVIGYLKAWFRFDLMLAISNVEEEKLSERGQQLLRFVSRE
jgi:ectoine hydroxylase-related dioxygenase (phytanoyl-CoA dioxygenase family)